MAKHIFDPMTNRKPTALRIAVSQVADEIADLHATIARLTEERDTAITDANDRRVAELMEDNHFLRWRVQTLQDEGARYTLQRVGQSYE